MTEKRAILLGWDEVCEITAKQIEALLGLQIKCRVNLMETVMLCLVWMTDRDAPKAGKGKASHPHVSQR